MIKIILFVVQILCSVQCFRRGEYFEFHGKILESFTGWVATERGRVYGFIPPEFQGGHIRVVQRGTLKDLPVEELVTDNHNIYDKGNNGCFREMPVKGQHFLDKMRVFEIVQKEMHCGNCPGALSWISDTSIRLKVCNDKKFQRIKKHLTRSRRSRRDFLEGSGTDEDFLHYDEEDEEEDDDDDSEDIDNQIFNTTIPTSTEAQVVTHVTTPQLPDPISPQDTIDNEIEEEAEEELAPSERIVLLLPTPTFSGLEVLPPSPSVSSPPLSSFVTTSFTIDRVFSSTAYSQPPPAVQFSSSVIFQDSFVGSGDGAFEEIIPTKTSEIYQSPQVYINNNNNNSPPQLQKSIQKQALKFGELFKMSIDPMTFHDPEDNSNFSLVLTPSEPWVYFNKRTLELTALPTIQEVSDWTFELVAVDKENSSSLPHEVVLSVRQRPKSRNYNHLFTLTFARVQIENGLEFKEFYQKMSEYLGDDLVVYEVGREYPYSFSFVNESLAVGGSCPIDDLKKIWKKLVTKNLPSLQLNRHMRPTFQVESVNLTPNPSSTTLCDLNQINLIKNTESKPMAENFPPSIKNQIDILNATVGRFLVYKVKVDFCYDPEDGDTTRLDLTLLDAERREVDSKYWLQFDKKNGEFYGLPMDGEKERTNFVLVCTDKGGKTANDALEVKITPRPPSNYNSEFSLQFSSLPFTPKNQRKFLEKLALAFKSDLDSIVVKEYSESNGHVLFKWFNATNPSTEYAITELRRILLSNEGPPEKKLVALFAPEFNLSVGNIVPRERLLGADTPIHFEKDPDIEESEDEINPVGDYSVYLLTYVIPSVLIAIMILLALIIACLLSRAKSKSIPVPTDEDEKKNFIKKGVPVIFQDELDDDKLIQPETYDSSRRSKSPSQPPQAALRSSTPQPPEYQPRKYRKELDNQPNYQPPPAIPYQYQQPGFRQQPMQTNPNYGYRKPPPYVPP